MVSRPYGQLTLAPWWGGFWERLVRSIKEPLRKVLGRQLVKFDEMTTILAEIEFVLNTRPLTHIDADTSTQIITPAHLLYGRSLLTCQQLKDENVPSIKCKASYRRVTTAIDHFWTRWHSEYLMELRSHHQSAAISGNEPKLNDIVLVKEKGVPRMMWKMARICELILGRDGQCRAAKLQLVTRGKPSLLTRPLQLLLPFEISDEAPETVN